MQFILVVILSCFIAATHSAEGPEAVDPANQQCSDYHDAGLSQLATCLGKQEFYEANGAPPCDICNVYKLGTLKRANDSSYEPANDGCFDHTLSLGFDKLVMDCNCKIENPDKSVSEGVLHADWTEPRISTKMLMCTEQKTVRIYNTEVLSKVADTAVLTCVGEDGWKQSCGSMVDSGGMYPTIEKAIEVAFPGESTKEMESDQKLLLELNCGEIKDNE